MSHFSILKGFQGAFSASQELADAPKTAAPHRSPGSGGRGPHA
ncbi:hypothetical protein [Corynebacterium sp. 209RC1]|nr:hypothetical protein [Corynebacterium sp. 209RC1]